MPTKRGFVPGLPHPRPRPHPRAPHNYCLSGPSCQATTLPSRSLRPLHIAPPPRIPIRPQTDHDLCRAAASRARHSRRRRRCRPCPATRRCLARRCLASRPGTKCPRCSATPSCARRYEWRCPRRTTPDRILRRRCVPGGASCRLPKYRAFARPSNT